MNRGNHTTCTNYIHKEEAERLITKNQDLKTDCQDKGENNLDKEKRRQEVNVFKDKSMKERKLIRPIATCLPESMRSRVKPV